MINSIVLIGKSLGYSKSQIMHTAALDALGLSRQYTYRPLEIAEKELIGVCRKILRGETAGANVTIPYKTAVIPYLDRLSPEAKKTGAVNTLYLLNGQLWGDNTDSEGFNLVLKDNKIDCTGKKILVLGYGGSARAVVSSLISNSPERIDICGRSIEKATTFIHNFNNLADLKYISPLKLKINDYRLIINTTPLGTNGENEKLTPINPNFLTKENIVIDLVYNPKQTIFLREAELKGCKTLNGLELLVNQGALSLEIWTGKKPDKRIMMEAINKN